MPLVVPESMPSDGTLKVTFLNTATATKSALLAGTELSCYLTSDGWNPTTDEATITDSRLCSKQDFEQPGRLTEGLEVTYVYNTQVSADDLARTTLARNSVGFLAVRWGIDVDEPWDTDQEYDLYPIKAGVQRKNPPEQNSVLKLMQKVFITGPVARDLVVV
jgi:hypothetical protein